MLEMISLDHIQTFLTLWLFAISLVIFCRACIQDGY